MGAEHCSPSDATRQGAVGYPAWVSDGDEIIAERYRLERVLGQGGMGVVWAARDLRSEERVALKFLKAGEGGEAGIRRFVREARAAMALSHPNIVHVHTLTADRHGSPVMVMDLLDLGESLATRLHRPATRESTLAGILALQIVSASR